MGVLAALLLATGTAMAGGIDSNQPFNISTPQSFQEQAAQVSAALSVGGEFAFLSTQDRARVERDIVAMTALLKHKGNIEAMTGAQRVELYNAQESANMILTRGHSGTTRCAWTQQTGSHILHTLCWSMQA
ncbi:MAG: hypothetical protein ACREPU_14360 [Rhodanobacteraceae bacterium]